MKNCLLLNAQSAFSRQGGSGPDRDYSEQPYDVPDSGEWTDESDDDDDFLWPPTDDADWDVFIPEDGEYEVEPDPDDFGVDEEPDG
jgi:hypothetical protein